jgi:excisionase family DNA binding protein
VNPSPSAPTLHAVGLRPGWADGWKRPEYAGFVFETRGDPVTQGKIDAAGLRRAYRVNEAAAAYRLSRSTIYKLMDTGALRSVKIGGRRLIPVDAIEALLAGNDQ